MRKSPEKPLMPQLMAGTAGHVDHGKTALIRLLTGCETDKLQEEKERGLSINLGFAPCRLPGNRMIGVIDVPGHIDFIRNMVSGASSIDILILVVAADDCIMPQTIEHAQIISLLRAPRLLVALTKIDLVDEETMELAMEEIKEFVAELGFPDAPICPVSNITGEGVPALRRSLDTIVSDFSRSDSEQAFRMNVERVFSVKGYGTVATGVPVAGYAEKGDFLELFPLSQKVKIRSIQNYQYDSENAVANVCCALNLSDLKAEELYRGMTLCAPGFYRHVSAALVELRNIHKNLTMRHNMDLAFMVGTAELKCKLKLIESNSLRSGEQGVAKLLFDKPVVLAGGDKFIVRRFSPSTTVGGGSILYPGEYKYKRTSSSFKKRLSSAAEYSRRGDSIKSELLAGPSPILSKGILVSVFRCEKSLLESKINELVNESFLGKLAESIFLVSDRLDELRKQIDLILSEYHRRRPYSWGMSIVDLSRKLDMGIEAGRKILELCMLEKSDFKLTHGRLANSRFKPELSKREMNLKEDIDKRVVSSANRGQPIKALAQELEIKNAEMQRFIKILVEEERLVSLDKYLMSLDAFNLSRQEVEKWFQNNDNLEINQFRDLIDTSRNMAVMLLEKFDALGLTRRTESGRILLSSE